jgi:hypothetical protein
VSYKRLPFGPRAGAGADCSAADERIRALSIATSICRAIRRCRRLLPRMRQTPAAIRRPRARLTISDVQERDPMSRSRKRGRVCDGRARLVLGVALWFVLIGHR